MSEEIQTPDAPEAEAQAPAAPIGPQTGPEGPDPLRGPSPAATRIKIGKVREFMACTVKQRGCKAPSMGNVFPVDHITGNLSKPFALACSACLTKQQDEGVWVIPG